MKMPNPLQFEKLIDKTTNLVEEIELSNDYSVRKIENTFSGMKVLMYLTKKLIGRNMTFLEKL